MHGRHRQARRSVNLARVLVTGALTAAASFGLASHAGAASSAPDGALVIHKFSGSDNTTVFPFTVNPGSISVPVTGNSDSAPQSLAPGTTYSISESVPSGWIFADAFCALESSSITGTQSGTGVTGIEIESGKTTTCYVSDDPQSPDLSLTKSASPKTFSAAGQTITYSVTARNVGTDTIFSLTINDPLLGGDLTDCTDDHGNPVTPPADLDPGDELRCTGTYQTTANDVTAGRIDNTALARGFVGEESRVSRTASTTVRFATSRPPGSPLLGVTKSSVPASGSTVHRGDQVVYTLAYGNTGTASATSVELTDPLPADLDYVTGTASTGGTYDATTRTLTWQLGTLAPGASGTVSFTGTVAPTATDGEVLHNVGAITAGGVTASSNAVDVTVDVPAPTGDVTISKAVDKDVAEFGDTLTYSITVGATGNKDQTHVVVIDEVPDGSSYVAGSAACDAPCTANESDGTVTWNVGTLTPGTSTVITFQVTVDTPDADADGAIPAERVTNIAQVTFDADPVEFSNKVDTLITAVKGEKAVRKPQPEPDVLPMTGPHGPLSVTDTTTVGFLTIAIGLVLVRRGRRPRYVPMHAEVIWRDQ